MHPSRMRTARSLTVSRNICHTSQPCHACPLPCMPPAMHPLACTTPCHTCPPLPCMPPTMQIPHHACPPATYPPAVHIPLPCMPSLPHITPPRHACPPCGQNSWHMLLKILPCPNFVAGGNYY